MNTIFNLLDLLLDGGLLDSSLCALLCPAFIYGFVLELVVKDGVFWAELDSLTKGEEGSDGGDVLQHVGIVIVFLCFDYKKHSLPAFYTAYSRVKIPVIRDILGEFREN